MLKIETSFFNFFIFKSFFKLKLQYINLYGIYYFLEFFFSFFFFCPYNVILNNERRYNIFKLNITKKITSPHSHASNQLKLPDKHLFFLKG